MADLQREIDALDRVLFRLASVDDERLLTVLDALLPQLLALFPATTALPLEFQLKDKILQVISHVKTRLHGIAAPRLPLVALSAILEADDASSAPRSPFTTTFAFMFIEMGFAAATSEEQTNVLERLAKTLVLSGATMQETFFRLLLSTFPGSTSTATRILAGGGASAADVVLDFLLDVVVYQPPNSTSAPESVVYGLLAPRIERLQRVKVTELKREALYDCQLHALQFVKNLGAAHPTRVLHYVAGASSFHHVVKAFCEEQLYRIRNEDDALLENPVLCRDLMALIMSSQVVSQGQQLQGRDALLLANRMRVADASILAATSLLKASKTATNVLPLVLQVICQLMFAEEPSRARNVAQRLKVAGAQLCEWTFHHASVQYLTQLLGPVLLPTLLRTVMDPNADLDTANAQFWREFRQHMYESVSVLCARAPSLVTSSEQSFQVLLVRCLVEEKSRAGVNALKAMNALREAFETSGNPSAVTVKIQAELTGLLRGSKLYDASSNYKRVRAIIGSWAETILVLSIKAEASADQTTPAGLRFALFKLCGDDDEGVRQAATKALYAKPLPLTETLARALQSQLDPQGSCGLQRCMSVREAQQCLSFLQAVMKEEALRMEDNDEEERRRAVLKYFVDTLLEAPNDTASKRDVASLCLSSSRQLIELHADFAPVLDSLLRARTHDLVRAMTCAATSSREALVNVSTLLNWSLLAGDEGALDVVDIMNSAITTLERMTASTTDICAALYSAGTIAKVLFGKESLNAGDGSASPMRALEILSAVLQKVVDSSSNFGSLPRGDEALDDLLSRLRSAIDAVGLTGNWNRILLDADVHESALKLRAATIEQLGKIISWKLDAISADGSVKARLNSIRAVALEAVANAVFEGTWPLHLAAPYQALVSCIFELGSYQESELQFEVAYTFVAIGTSSVEENSSPFCLRLVERILQDGAEARQVPIRRSATVWLLCVCAAGLSSTNFPAWNGTFRSASFAATIVRIHEFFVTMLNDADPVTTECAVKGLAYLRLKAPSPEIGELFSDSLFRRLRCFRAFAPSSATSNEINQDDDDADQSSVTPPPPTAVNQPTQSGETVENVAYREVSNVAADIGDPELMYSLLYLSTTNPIWQALPVTGTQTYSSARFSFPVVDQIFRRGIIEQASQQWMSEAFEHRKKLIPWLFLLKNHSNPKVSGVMGNLWNFAKGELVISTSQEKSLLNQQWDTIFHFLLTKLEYSRNFKYREASCLALIDLLNGADASHIEASFVRLWTLTSRSVDDIMEAVAVAGLKLFKALGELSLRIAVKHEGCRRDLLDYWTTHGMTTKNVVCRALCIDLLLRLVKEVNASALKDRLGALMLKLLEYLSSLEMPELQYAQFHVGDKKDQLERLRVSMSQSGPVGQLLDQCMLKLKTLATESDASSVQIVDEISRGVASLLKFGVGLNTRVGTANFAATLATELPFELRKCGGAELILSRALAPYVTERSASENDHYGDEDTRYETSAGVPDGLVLQSYLRAAAYLCPLAEPSSVKNYVRAAVFAVHRIRQVDSNADSRTTKSDGERFADVDTYTSRFLMVSALATKELVSKCPPITDASAMVSSDNRNEWYAANVFPAAFIGQHASSQALRSVWTAVLEDLPPRITYATEALEATLSVLARWIRHPSWDTRRQGVKSLQALFSKSSSHRGKMTASQTDQIWNELLSAVPGRLWRGKGVILEALVAIASVRIDESSKLASLLLEECDRAWKNYDMEYLESALTSLGKLATEMSSSPESQVTRLQLVKDVRTRLGEWQRSNPEDTSGVEPKTLPPMMVKVVFETLSAVIPPRVTTEDGAACTGEMLQWLDSCLADASFHVWSVRRSVFATTATVVRSAPASAFSSHHTINRLVDRCCGDVGVGDGKYSMVRISAGDVLVALASRHAEPSIAMQLTTHRERLSAAVDVLRGSDEPKEQQVAAQIFSQLAHSVAA